MWVIMKTLTFGQMSKMYSFLTTSVKTKVSLHFKYVSEKELIQYMKRTNNLNQKKFLETMGFPKNWKNISRYKY